MGKVCCNWFITIHNDLATLNSNREQLAIYLSKLHGLKALPSVQVELVA